MGAYGIFEYVWLFEFSLTFLALLAIRAVIMCVALSFCSQIIDGKQRPFLPSQFDEYDSIKEKVAQIVLGSSCEEIIYRWLIPFFMVPVFRLGDWFTLGLVGWGYRNLVAPVADWFTLGFLSPQLTEGWWVVGAAMLSANAKFRRGHRYQGPIGVVNSWFGGMIYFYAMFNYGLGMAILAHCSYNLTILALDSLRETIINRPAWA